jgi:hypothetical protein
VNLVKPEQENMEEITWDEYEDTPFYGDMSDFHNWNRVSHIRLGYNNDQFEWVKYKRRDSRGRVFHTASSLGTTDTWPEDIWGLRFKELDTSVRSDSVRNMSHSHFLRSIDGETGILACPKCHTTTKVRVKIGAMGEVKFSIPSGWWIQEIDVESTWIVCEPCGEQD